MKCARYIFLTAAVMAGTLLLDAREEARVPDYALKLRGRLQHESDALCVAWIQAATSHRNASSPSFRLAAGELVAIRKNVQELFERAKLVMADKTRLRKGPDVTEGPFRYSRQQDRVMFAFPFVDWNFSEIVVVFDSAIMGAQDEQLECDYVCRTVDALALLSARRVYLNMRAAAVTEADSVEVISHIFGGWYGSQAAAISP